MSPRPPQRTQSVPSDQIRNAAESLFSSSDRRSQSTSSQIMSNLSSTRLHPSQLYANSSFGSTSFDSDDDSNDEQIRTGTNRSITVDRASGAPTTPMDRNVHRLRQLLRTGSRDGVREGTRDQATSIDYPTPPRSSHGIQATTTYASRHNTRMHPSFRNKTVVDLNCKYCDVNVCRRGMRAILLADTSIELFSTDLSPRGCEIVGNDYRTQQCACRIRDLACHCCGNVLGYHVVLPCNSCLSASHNSHMYMFHSDAAVGKDRLDDKGELLKWGQLSSPEVESLPSPFDTPTRSLVFR